jgi:hypothetical protein
MRTLPRLAMSLLAAVVVLPAAPALADRADLQHTLLISRAVDGGLPNGPSSNAVISNDRRWARIIAFQSTASNLVSGDVNGHMDVFVVRRAGSFGNDGARWVPGPTRLVSRGRGGQPANGPSFAPAVDGNFRRAPRCIGFLSAASNLVRNDTNGRVDAFVARLRTGKLRRVSLPGGRQAGADTTDVVVSGNCSRISFVTGGVVYTRKGRRTRKLGPGRDPSYSTGTRSDLVYADGAGVRMSRQGTRRGRLVVPGGRNPAFNDIKRRVVAYEKVAGGAPQIFWRELGRGGERAASGLQGRLGNADSRDPVIGNSGYYITYESEASNLGVNSLGRTGDLNGRPDAYLYTGVRDLTLVQSVKDKAVPLPGGGANPDMSFYANYITFDSPAPLGSVFGTPQVFMRYLGPV